MNEELTHRVRSLEEWRAKQETRTAVEAEQRKHMDARFDRIEQDVREGFKEIKGAFVKFLWAVGVVVIGVAVNWALKGGFIGG